MTQIEADGLLAMPKTFAMPLSNIDLKPGANGPPHLLFGVGAERFLLDLSRGSFRLSKVKYQTRGRQVIVLVRLCFNASPHRNPDGTRVPATHLHTYRQGYDDRWVEQLPNHSFSNPADPCATFLAFCAFCTIAQIPPFKLS